MKTTRLVSTCLLTCFILSARAQSASTFIQAGRDALIQKNLAAANSNFKAAVVASPADQQANVLYAATRLLVLPNKAAVESMLTRLNVETAGRDIYDWTADFQVDSNGVPVLPDNLNTTEIVGLIRTELLPEIAGALENLAKVTDTSFTLRLSRAETSIDDVTIDYGDVQMLRALLHALQYFGFTLNAYNWDSQWLKIGAWLRDDELSVQALLQEYPQWLQFAASENVDSAKTAFQNAVDRYLAASGHIRGRPQTWHRLFNLDPEMIWDEQSFRDTLVDLRASLNQPTPLRHNPEVTVYLARHFDKSTSLRSQLPYFKDNDFVLGSLPDPTFGGLFPNASEAEAEKAWNGLFDFAAPSNDAFADRIPIGDAGSSIIVTGSNGGASTEFGERLSPWSDGGHSVWWSWTPSASGTVTVAADSSRFEPLLSVFTGTNLTSLVLISERSGIAGIVPAQVSFEAGAGTNYQVRISDQRRSDRHPGNVTLKILKTTPPTIGLTSPTHQAAFAAGSNVTIVAEAVDADGAISRVDFFYEGPPFADSPVLLQSVTNSPYQITWSNAPAGPAYLVAQAVDSGGATAFASTFVSLTNAPAINDDFTNRLVLTGASVEVRGATDSAGLEMDEPLHGGPELHASVWYEWTAPVSGMFAINVDVEMESWSPVTVAVYTGTDLTNLTQVAVISEPIFGGDPIELFVAATGGMKYQIAVASSFAPLSTFELSITQTSLPTISLVAPASGGVFVAPTNLIRFHAQATAGADAYVERVDFYSSGTLLGTSTGEPYWLTLADVAPQRHTNLYAVVTDSQGLVSTSAVSGFTVTLPPTVQLAISPNRIRPSTDSTILAAAAADSDGTIAKVEFFEGANSLGVVTSAPYSLAISNLTTGARFITARATDNDGVESDSAPMQLTVNSLPIIIFTAPLNNTVYSNTAPITLSASAFDGDGRIVEVRFYSKLSEGDPVFIGTATNKPYSVVWTNISPGNYRLFADALDDLDGMKETAPITIAVATALLPPPNDHFANAIGLSGSASETVGSNVNATPEAAEPPILGRDAAKSVWWSWVAPATGSASVRTDGSGFDTLLAVYAGDSVTSLTLVGADDDSGEGYQSLVRFQAVAGMAYRIKVDGVSGRSGRIVLSVSLNAAPVVGWVSPTAGTRFEPGTNITLVAQATDPNGVSQVEFSQGGTRLGTVTNGVNGRYTYTWTGVAAGDYTLTAAATDTLGATGTSEPLSLKVSLPPAEALRFVEIALGTNQLLRLKIKGQAGLRAIIESSESLTNWTVLTSPFVIVSSGTNELDNLEMSASKRYYRARALEACSYTVQPGATNHSADSESASLNVAAGTGCSWTAESQVTWIHVIGNPSGVGSGMVSYEVEANALETSRTGTVQIAEATFTVTQAGRAQVVTANRGKVLSSTRLSAEQLIDIFEEEEITLLARVVAYRVVYETVDPQGETTQASGALFLPENPDRALPLASYQHGTVVKKEDVPSRMNAEGLVIGSLFAAGGYAVAAPDYLGLGDSPGLHPYLHAASEATAVIDMLRAARSICLSNSVALNSQLFLFGYSQGGHATMAAHRQIEANHASEFQVTAAAPMAGAYDLSGVTTADFLSDRNMPNPLYFGYVIRAYQDLYHLGGSLADVLAPPYEGRVLALFDGQHDYDEINPQMPNPPKLGFKAEYLEAFRNDSNHPLRAALAANDVYKWVPQAPVRLYHCQQDEDVVFSNATVAFEYFQSHGAPQVQLKSSDGDHETCFGFSFEGTKTWFDSLKQ